VWIDLINLPEKLRSSAVIDLDVSKQRKGMWTTCESLVCHIEMD